MDARKIRRETQRVVQKILKLVESYDTIDKTDFETILDHVIEQVHRNTGLGVEVIGQKTHTVVQALPQEYGQLPEEARSWKAMITYLYLKYLQELGVLKD
jgi:ATP-dependent exoDNAse (exonuclease V) beta subunit